MPTAKYQPVSIPKPFPITSFLLALRPVYHGGFDVPAEDKKILTL
jgi:hypothetical protein